MKNLLRATLFLGLSIYFSQIHAQVGIGTETPSPSSQLEIVSGDRGILIPQVALKSETDQSTISAGNVESLLVWNTSANQDMIPGYYYWYNGKWQRLLSSEMLTNLQDNGDGTFTYTDEAGNLTTFDANTTSYTDNGDGTFTFTNANGHTMTIDTNADAIAFDNTNNDFVADNVQDALEEVMAQAEKHDRYTGVVPIQITESPTPNASGGEDYTVSVDHAEGTRLGVVKEAEKDPTVTINEEGELAVNLETVNAIKRVSRDYELLPTDKIILADASSGSLKIELPSPTDVKGKEYLIKKEDTNQANYVNVVGDIAGTEGRNLYTGVPYTGWLLVSDGDQWQIIDNF